MSLAIDTVEEFWAWEQVEAAYAKACPDSRDKFQSAFGTFIGVNPKRVHLMPSARSGLESLLKARRDSRRTVLMPAFNCSVVRDAAVSAGYQVETYDFGPQPGLFDWGRVIVKIDLSIGVLIVTHYFGVPVDFRPVVEHCRKHGIAIIEDCAHTLGGSIEGIPVGSIGDAAIFSFNYDKPISLGWGGIVSVNNPLVFDAQLSTDFEAPNHKREITLLRQFMSAMAERRRTIPYQNLSLTRVLRRFRVLKPCSFHKPSNLSLGSIQAELGCWCLGRYPKVLMARKKNVEILRSQTSLQSWPVGHGINAAWLKQKVCIPDENLRTKLSKHLQRNGIRAGNFNWPILIEGKGYEDFPHALDASTNWIDVPIHQNHTDESLSHLAGVLEMIRHC